jgi:type I restriction enzyme R subunit
LSKAITESEVEQVALDILTDLGYEAVFGPDIAPDGDRPERSSYAEVVLLARLRSAIDKLNPKIPNALTRFWLCATTRG